jgi:hypothetical protein
MIQEDKAYEQALRLHPELAGWKMEDFERVEAEEGVNWFLHLNIDAVVFRRAGDASLPDGEVIKELEGQGQSEHEAVHMIARLVAEDLWARLQTANDLPDDDSQDVLPAEVTLKLNTMSDDLNRKIRALTQ